MQEQSTPLRIGDEVPDFSAESTQGPIDFHDWIGDGWAVLFSHPKDFTPVCTTELGYMAGLEPEFHLRGCKIVGLSIDSVSDHAAWIADIESTQGHAVDYPLIGDTDLRVAKLFNMIHPNASGDAGERSASDNQTIRSVFVIGPDKRIKATLTYPMSTGRNFDEILRLLDSCQLTAKHKVATPVNWKQGEDVIIVPAVSDDEARERFPGGWQSPRPYIRIVPQPSA
jgi:alkyl hydroperoxide reductase subunit AhpC